MTAAFLVQDWWQIGLVVIAVGLLYVVRLAKRRASHQRAQTQELLTEWETYQRRRDQ